MVRELLAEPTINHLFKITTHFLKLPTRKMWLDYDNEADVLYLHFEEKPVSTYSEMGENGIILDYRDKQLVGLTILEASSRTSGGLNALPG